MREDKFSEKSAFIMLTVSFVCIVCMYLVVTFYHKKDEKGISEIAWLVIGIILNGIFAFIIGLLKITQSS